MGVDPENLNGSPEIPTSGGKLARKTTSTDNSGKFDSSVMPIACEQPSSSVGGSPRMRFASRAEDCEQRGQGRGIR
jgi:hypothetical protein